MGDRRVTLGHVVLAGAALVGAAAAASSISDNSMLSHLRTGIDMVDSHSIPRRDIYSFTAPGEPWLVQSWFAEWTYGLAHHISDYAVVFQQMLLAGLVTFVMAVLARSRDLVGSVVAFAVPGAIAFPLLAQRPLLFGLLCFALMVLVVERRMSSLWLLPIMWVWVNTHGSFPVGLVWLLLTAVGSALDRHSLHRRYLHFGGAYMGGLALACINPLGPKLLMFWTTAFGDRREVFNSIIEWKTPNFHDAKGLMLLGLLSVAVVVVARVKTSWRLALPVAVFLGAALMSARYLPAFAIVLCPAMAAAFSSDWRSFFGGVLPKGSPNQPALEVPTVASPLMTVAMLAVLAFAFAVMSIRVLSEPAVDVSSYPVRALAWLQSSGRLGPTHRLASKETVGCYRIYSEGAARRVFIDDRFDMYPAAVSKDYIALVNGSRDPKPILDRYDIDTVLWEKDTPLTSRLGESASWHQVWADTQWAVFVKSVP